MTKPHQLNRRRPLLLYPHKTVVTPPRLFPSLDYYAAVCLYENIYIDWDARYDKRDKEARRYKIADVNGLMHLTVPVIHPRSITSSCWNDILISSHGDWQAVHLTALESAYGRTPYFEFYIDSLRPLFSREWNDRPLKDYVILSHDILSSLLPFPPVVTLLSSDCEYLGSRISSRDLQPEYWQPRADRLGFIPGLSVLDALFSLGPETLFLIQRLSSNFPQRSERAVMA